MEIERRLLQLEWVITCYNSMTDYGSGSMETWHKLVNLWLGLFDMPTTSMDQARSVFHAIYKKTSATFPYGFCYDYYTDDGVQACGDVSPNRELIGRVRLFTRDVLMTHFQIPLVYVGALADVEITKPMVDLIGTEWWLNYNRVRYSFEYWFKRLFTEGGGVVDLVKVYQVLQNVERKYQRGDWKKRKRN